MRQLVRSFGSMTVLSAGILLTITGACADVQAQVHNFPPSGAQGNESLENKVKAGDTVLQKKYNYRPNDPNRALDVSRVNPGGDQAPIMINGKGALAIYSANDCVIVTFQLPRGVPQAANTDEGFPLFEYSTADSGHMAGDIHANLMPKTRESCYVVFRYYHKN